MYNDTFSHAFNCGLLVAVSILQELDEQERKAALPAIQRTAGKRIEQIGMVSLEDTMLLLEPFANYVKEQVDGSAV